MFELFEPFPALLAFTPLIVYLFLFAVIRIGGLVWVSTGGRDLAAVLFAISGFIVIGPMELFFPNATASFLGVWVWAPLTLLYFLFGCLLILSTKPKLVVYGRAVDEVYPALVDSARTLDGATIANDGHLQVYLPTVQAHFRLEAMPGYDCISIVSFEPMLSSEVWRRLRTQLRERLRASPPPRPRRGWAMLGIALMMGYFLTRHVATQPALLVEGFREWMIR